MHAITAGLFAAGLLLALAAIIGVLLTRGTADGADLSFTQWLSTVAQLCTGLALTAFAHYGYRPADGIRDCVYAAMAAAVLSLVTRLPAIARA